MGYGARCLGVLVCLVAPLVAPRTASAQLAPVGVPPGVVRIEVDGTFDTWDHVFRDGNREPLGSAFSTSALGSDLLPSLATYDTLIGRVTGIGDYRLNLGSVTGDAHADVTSAKVGLALGVFKGVTVFGRLPLTRARMQTTLDVGADGNAGPNPGAAAQQPFFEELGGALTTLESQIAAGAYDADPASRALAEATLTQGTQLFADLFTLLGDPATASPFIPTGSSEAGVALDSRLDGLQTTLESSLGVGGFAARPSLPAEPATTGDVAAYIGNPFGPIGVQPGDEVINFRGDAETGLAVTLADRWDRDGKRGGFRAAAEGLVRLPTGRSARNDRLLAIGTGDGQIDVEVRGVVDLGSGNIGVRLEGGYSRQLAFDVVDAVAPPGDPFPPDSLLTTDSPRSRGRHHPRRPAFLPARAHIRPDRVGGALFPRPGRGRIPRAERRDPGSGPRGAGAGYGDELDRAQHRGHLLQPRRAPARGHGFTGGCRLDLRAGGLCLGRHRPRRPPDPGPAPALFRDLVIRAALGGRSAPGILA